MSTSTLTALLAAAALATAIGSAPAVFAEDTGAVSATVNYSDLNLASPEGAKTMLQRINQAAEQVCAPRADIGDYTGRAEWDDCVASRIDLTVTRLGSPMVTAAYAGKRSSKTQLAGR
jgi:UrcA family protein